MESKTITVNGKALTIRHGEYYSSVYKQAINPKTGQPWQAIRYIAQFTGEGRERKAWACWLRESRGNR